MIHQAMAATIGFRPQIKIYVNLQSRGIVALSVIAAALCMSCSVMTPILATKLAGQYVTLDVIGLLMPHCTKKKGRSKLGRIMIHEKRKTKMEMKEWRDGFIVMTDNELPNN
nr:probable sodium/metabolite cotransporter BASS1, chloroplastic [Tanacetum cinerariifolium]